MDKLVQSANKIIIIICNFINAKLVQMEQNLMNNFILAKEFPQISVIAIKFMFKLQKNVNVQPINHILMVLIA
jgi:hypothetical protein